MIVTASIRFWQYSVINELEMRPTIDETAMWTSMHAAWHVRMWHCIPTLMHRRFSASLQADHRACFAADLCSCGARRLVHAQCVIVGSAAGCAGGLSGLYCFCFAGVHRKLTVRPTAPRLGGQLSPVAQLVSSVRLLVQNPELDSNW